MTEKLHIDPLAPDYREAYSQAATFQVRVALGRVHFDDGYREAEEGDLIFINERDFRILIPIGHVEEVTLEEVRAKGRK